jgi:hypothetical protein
MKEYKVVIYREGLLGSLFLGESKVDPDNFTEFLNEQAREGANPGACCCSPAARHISW